MATVQIQQADAHLVDAPRFRWVQVGAERRAMVTFVAISNHVRGSGETRREKATAIRWTAWGPQAEAHAAYLGCGSHVNVTGRMVSNQYAEADTGRTVYGYDFVAETVHYLDSKDTAQARRSRAAVAARPAALAQEPTAPDSGRTRRAARASRVTTQAAA